MREFDDLIQDIRNEQPDAQAAEQAAGRVRRSLFGEDTTTSERIRGCADFQSLISSYLEGTLPGPRRLLMEDHLSECVACRRAVERTRGEGSRTVVMPERRAAAPRLAPRWAIAAAIVVAAGAGTFAMWRWLPGTVGGAPRVTVQAVNGTLYQVGYNTNQALRVGQEVGEQQGIRTGRGSTALLKMQDGSLIEMNERTDIELNGGWRGAVIRVNRGQVIVQAAKQRYGRLAVDSGDCLVTVKGTIFSVNRGTIGSRVAVVEGEVQVDHAGRTQMLKPGGQAATESSAGQVSVADEISWSRNATQYLALLGELNVLQRKLEAVLMPGLRYQSRLLAFIPEDTFLFVAIPNVAASLGEAQRIFEDRLRESQVLRDWWSSDARRRAELERMIQFASELGRYLGDEVVVAVSGRDHEEPLIMAEVRGAGLKEFLDRKIAEAGGKQPPFQYSITNNILLVAADAPRLAQAQALVARGGTASTRFRDRITEAYRSGAGWLVAADLEQVVAKMTRGAGGRPPLSGIGIDTAQFVILERKEVSGKTENRAAVSFRGQRHGMAAWLAAPGPMSTLSFVSPDAGGALSVVTKSPRAMLEELLALGQKADKRFGETLAKLEQTTGLRVLDDLAAPLGTEATFALDGPLFPLPSWKLAIEVQWPERLQMSFEKIVETYNRDAPAQTGQLALTREQAGQRTFYKIASAKLPWEIHYTFVDGYLLAGANRPLLTQAIQNRQTGHTLIRSDRFRSQVPLGSNINFSAVVYQNMGSVLGPLVDQLANAANTTPAQRQSMEQVKNMNAGLLCAYAESDRILVAGTGSGLFGLDLSTIAGLGVFEPHQKKQRVLKSRVQ